MSSANPTSNDAPEPPLQWSKRLQDGTFRCSYKDGSVYTGELQGGKRHGQGAQTWTDGDTYSGSWVDDKRHGLGKVSLRFLVFSFWFLVQLIGQLYDDVPFWQYVYAMGDTYEGEWCDNNIHGNGSYTHTLEGEVYTGEFLNNSMHGNGM